MVNRTSSTILTTSCCRYHPHNRNPQSHNPHGGKINIIYQIVIMNHYFSKDDRVNMSLRISEMRMITKISSAKLVKD